MADRRTTRRAFITASAGAVALPPWAVSSSISSSSAISSPSTIDESASGQGLASPRRISAPVHRLPTWTVGAIGTSVEGRPIRRFDSRPEQPERHVVVICGIHGDERDADELADGFGRIDRPDDLHLTIVPFLNPDGWAASTRSNANGVDLNRNFPWAWPRQFGSGAGPASEPETRAAIRLLTDTRPDLVVWVHQPLGYVAALDGCPSWYADIWADVSGVPVRRSVRQVGGGESWSSEVLRIPSMLVEVGGSRSVAFGVDGHVEALEALIFAVRPS